MKNLTTKLIASLTILAALMASPAHALASDSLEVSATYNNARSQQMRTEVGDIVQAADINDRYNEVILNIQRGYSSDMLVLQTTNFAPVTFTISRDGQVLKTITIPAPGMSYTIPANDLQ